MDEGQQLPDWARSEQVVREYEAMTQAAKNKQVGGDHYKDWVIQPIEFIQANDLEYCAANVIKYVCRHDKKGGVQDLDKAIHYIQLLKEHTYP